MEHLSIEGAKIIFRNFAGKQGKYNKDGDRSFSIVLDDKTAEELVRDGWNVKFPQVDEESEFQREPYLPVAVRFDVLPPKVFLVNGERLTSLTEDTVYDLDNLEFVNIDLVIRPYQWSIKNRDGSIDTGIKAYLDRGYFEVDNSRNPFAEKYANYIQ